LNSILHKATASHNGTPEATTEGKYQNNNYKDTNLDQLRADRTAALKAWKRAESALEQDRRLARAQRRREDPRLGPRVMEAYNLYDKLEAKLSWAEGLYRKRPQMAPSKPNPGDFIAPTHPNRYTKNRTSQGVSVANRFSPLAESDKNSGSDQGF
jgi:hypothetical protein